jgi:phthalate 4,5-cis-dihydrodiol dehydrogenase
VFSQAAHQVDIVRLLVGCRATRIRAAVGKWDPARPTEGAYTATLWFENGAFATLSYNGYAHFDSDEWTDWTGEMGQPKDPDDYGHARRKLSAVTSSDEETRLKAAGAYGGKFYTPVLRDRIDVRKHQHFGPLIVSCERGDIRPLSDSIVVYGDERRERIELDAPTVPRVEVINELIAAVHGDTTPLHDGAWARSTLEICLAMLLSSNEQRDVLIGAD